MDIPSLGCKSQQRAPPGASPASLEDRPTPSRTLLEQGLVALMAGWDFDDILALLPSTVTADTIGPILQRQKLSRTKHTCPATWGCCLLIPHLLLVFIPPFFFPSPLSEKAKLPPFFSMLWPKVIFKIFSIL